MICVPNFHSDLSRRSLSLSIGYKVPGRTEMICCLASEVKIMGIATEILSLRRNPI